MSNSFYIHPIEPEKGGCKKPVRVFYTSDDCPGIHLNFNKIKCLTDHIPSKMSVSPPIFLRGCKKLVFTAPLKEL